MDAVTGIAALKAVQGVTEAVAPLVSGEGSEFDAVLKGMLSPDSANNVNEEELFAALLHERILAAKGEEAAGQFQSAFEEQKESKRRADGYVNVEDAAQSALSSLIESGALSAEEGEKIRSEAWDAAQLDDNYAELWDGRGEEGDPTIAVMDLEAALLRARTTIEAFDGGEAQPGEHGGPQEESAAAGGAETSEGSAETGAESAASESSPIDGEQSGFLFKPVSDSGELVVLLPAQMAHEVQAIILKDKDGNEIERGRSSGYANPDQHGEREHFRFNHPGGEYPEDLVVEVQLADGSTREYRIPDPSQRYD